ncbi:MAG: uroporphyrinogen-III synthase, partial [Bacteroidota bacterium]|nr:uroporphyrinogen-III synthase [Bacteroidota bacterium]
RNTLYNKLKRRKLNIHKAVFYNTISSDLTDIKLDYDIIVLFSPSGVKSLTENFPETEKYKFQIAAFGTTTTKAVTKAGLKTFIKAPTSEFPSMAMAIESYIRKEEFDA